MIEEREGIYFKKQKKNHMEILYNIKNDFMECPI
jgi:hypothetical protein